ncbi:MAG: decaprenyl-phosphate phosphoribosyltransferase [Kofleriaceae bacterium]
MSPAVALIRTLRPHQWVKNLFVLAPLVFGRHLLETAFVARGVAAALIFCVLSGAVYAFNDVRDVAADRLHPTKRHRPIAAGALGERTALAWAGGLAAAALVAAAVLAPWLAVIAASYLAINLAYSVGLKRVAFVDVLLVGSGFLLRVLGGAVAIEVPASRWLLLCTGLLAVLLALGKRAQELAWAARAGGDVGATRAALAGYRLPVVRALMIVLAVATTGAYLAYTLDAHTIEFFHTDRLAWTVPFPVLGITRFLWLAMWRGQGESPTEAMLRDLPFLANLAAWAAAVVVIVYG